MTPSPIQSPEREAEMLEKMARAIAPWAWVEDYAYESRVCSNRRTESLIEARAALSAVRNESVADRNAVIEEAALAAERTAKTGWVNGEATTSMGRFYQKGCTDSASAIRSLKTKTEGNDG